MQFDTLSFTGHEDILKRVGELPTYATLLIGTDQSGDAAACKNESCCKMSEIPFGRCLSFILCTNFYIQVSPNYHINLTLTLSFCLCPSFSDIYGHR